MSKIYNVFVIEINNDWGDFTSFAFTCAGQHMGILKKWDYVSFPTFNAFMDVVFIYPRFSRATLGCKYSVLLFPKYNHGCQAMCHEFGFGKYGRRMSIRACFSGPMPYSIAVPPLP